MDRCYVGTINEWGGTIKGYFDIHSHILPGVDDGAKNLDETRRMLHRAYDEGIRVIVATPHFLAGGKNPEVDRLKEIFFVVAELAAEVSEELQVILGNELFYNASLIDSLNRGEALTIDGTRYILVEFSPRVTFRSMWEGLNNCIFAGYIPILAHTERYQCLLKEPELVNDFIRLGAYIQLNFSCIRSKGFHKRSKFSHKLLKRGWVHFLGTDTHGAYEKTLHTKKVVSFLRKKFGEERIRLLLWENPMTMVENEHLKF